MVRLAMQEADHVGGRLLEVDRRQARPGTALDRLLAPQDPLADALGESARRLSHPSADQIDDRFRKGDLAVLVEHVLG